MPSIIPTNYFLRHSILWPSHDYILCCCQQSLLFIYHTLSILRYLGQNFYQKGLIDNANTKGSDYKWIWCVLPYSRSSSNESIPSPRLSPGIKLFYINYIMEDSWELFFVQRLACSYPRREVIWIKDIETHQDAQVPILRGSWRYCCCHLQHRPYWIYGGYVRLKAKLIGHQPVGITHTAINLLQYQAS